MVKAPSSEYIRFINSQPMNVAHNPNRVRNAIVQCGRGVSCFGLADCEYKTNESLMNICCCCNVDRDECSENLCGPHANSCNNLDGSYTCVCKDGYEFKDGTCIGRV